MSAMLTRLCGIKYPNIAARLKDRHDLYNRSVELLRQWENEGRAFVIRPSEPIRISRIEKDPDKLQAVYDLGVKDGNECLSELRAYMKG